MNFDALAGNKIKLKESEKNDKYLGLASELKKIWNMKVTMIPIVIGAFAIVTKELLKGLEDMEISGLVETIQTYSYILYGQTTEKSPGNLRGLYANKTLLKDH